jgi:AcrR family transcriptional regulator
MEDALTKTHRERQRDATAEIILAAVGRCLEDVELTELTFTQVARVAGLGERTIYRYFPNKEALLDGWWRAHKARLGQDAFPDTLAALLDFPVKAFPSFDEEAEIMRGAVLSPQGRAMTLARNEERQAAIRRAVQAELGPEASEEMVLTVCASVQLLQSATAWLTMRDYWDLSGDQSGPIARRAIQAIFTAARNGTL